MSKDPKYDCAIVVPSCDEYEDSWLPFFSFLFKYWTDCPFQIYLVTNSKIYPDARVKTLALGVDHGWANNMKIALDQIPEKYFIYFLEDVFLTKKIDTERIIKYLDLVKKDSISCLRLFPEPGPDKQYLGHPDLGIIGNDAPYRVSTMTSIWNKDSFIGLIKPGENAWQMELDGTKRSSKMNELFLSVWPKNYAVEYLATAIKKGRWIYDAVTLCKREGIEADFTKRPIETRGHYIYRKMYNTPVVGWFMKIPRRFKKLIKL